MRDIILFGEYSFDNSSMLVMRGIDIIDLPHRQREALFLLLNARGATVSRHDFLSQIWKDVVVEEHNLTQTIFMLRRTLGRLPDGQEYIETVPRRGYRMSFAALNPRNVREMSYSRVAARKLAGRQLEHSVSAAESTVSASKSNSIVRTLARRLGWMLSALIALSVISRVARNF